MFSMTKAQAGIPCCTWTTCVMRSGVPEIATYPVSLEALLATTQCSGSACSPNKQEFNIPHALCAGIMRRRAADLVRAFVELTHASTVRGCGFSLNKLELHIAHRQCMKDSQHVRTARDNATCWTQVSMTDKTFSVTPLIQYCWHFTPPLQDRLRYTNLPLIRQNRWWRSQILPEFHDLVFK